MKIRELEALLLERWPKETAASWDTTGLKVGDPEAEVTRVVCALDATLPALMACKNQGANVLITHHPIYLEAPHEFSSITRDYTGYLVRFAIEEGIALINFHTALDVSEEAFTMLPHLCSLTPASHLVPTAPNKGYGQISNLEAPHEISHVINVCKQAFSRIAKVWSKKDAQIIRIATWTGSIDAEGVEACFQHNVDVLICGEIKYHVALDAYMRGLHIIELGHDVSELPFVDVLVEQVNNVGITAAYAFKDDTYWTQA